MCETNKRDFRDGSSARARMSESIKAIREALSLGELTFGKIMIKTGLSKPALSSNLAKMIEKGEIKKREDPSDSRLRYYSLTKEGWKEFYKNPIEEIVSRIDNVIADYLACAVDIAAIKQSGEDKNVVFPQLNAIGVEVLTKCLTGQIYGLTVNNERVGFLEPLKEFMTQIKMLSDYKGIDNAKINQLSDVHFDFVLEKERFVELIETIKKYENYEDYKSATTKEKNC